MDIDELRRIEESVPPVSDKALVDLVNGIQVNRDLIRYRRQQGLFAQAIDRLSGRDRQRELQIKANLVAGQSTLHQWILELCDSLRISQVALEVTQRSLLDTRNVLRQHKQQLEGVGQLLACLNDLSENLSHRIDHLETRMRRLELRTAAKDDFDRILWGWRSRRTYQDFPWCVQVALLAREMFSGAIAIYEAETGDRDFFRSLLVDAIVAESRDIPDEFFGLAALLDLGWQEMSSTEMLWLAAGLLETRSLPQSQLQRIPLRFALATTLELASLPVEMRSPKPAKAALELCKRHLQRLNASTDKREYTQGLVAETADDRLELFLTARKR